jgi:drug/metabolite transporter (DMT)-like permease
VKYLPGIFSLIVLAAGWHYIFYSPAAKRLSAIEPGDTNRFRVRLRRLNGVVMMLLAVAFYASYYTFDERQPRMFTWCFMTSILLLGAMVVLALIDLQLTRKLRAERKRKNI